MPYDKLDQRDSPQQSDCRKIGILIMLAFAATACLFLLQTAQTVSTFSKQTPWLINESDFSNDGTIHDAKDSSNDLSTNVVWPVIPNITIIEFPNCSQVTGIFLMTTTVKDSIHPEDSYSQTSVLVALPDDDDDDDDEPEGPPEEPQPPHEPPPPKQPPKHPAPPKHPPKQPPSPKEPKRPPPKQPFSNMTILEVLHLDPKFSHFASIVSRSSSLRDDLGDPELQEVSMFAPTNAALEYYFQSCENGTEAIKRLENKNFGHDDSDEGDDEERLPGIDLPIRSILDYHIIPGILTRSNLHTMRLLPTQYNPKHLRYQPQQIRVSHVKTHIMLNFHVGVSPSAEIQTKNGNILAIDSLLIPPPNGKCLVDMLPGHLSVFALATRKTDIDDKLKHKGVSVFAPDDAAWRSLGQKTLIWLFSKQGKAILERVVRYHIGREVAYQDYIARSPVPLKDLETFLPLHEDDEESKGKWLDCWKHKPGRRLRVKVTEHHGRKELSVNDNARGIVTDIPIDNGVVHIIDRVLIPDDIELPEDLSIDDNDVQDNASSIQDELAWMT